MKKEETKVRKTKIGAIIQHLVRYGSITDPYCRDKIHSNRLSGYICVLRKRGFVIESEWCEGVDSYGKYRYTKYNLISVPKGAI